MPHRQQILNDLAALDALIADGMGYLQRMEDLIKRMLEKEHDTAEQEKVIAEMRSNLQGFGAKRQQLVDALEGVDPLPDRPSRPAGLSKPSSADDAGPVVAE